MKKTIDILAAILAFACFLAIASCNGTNPINPDPTDPQEPSDPVPVAGVSITTDDPAQVAVKGTLALTASVTPSNATNKGVAWTIDKDTYATINISTGVVTGKKKGKAVVTVTTMDGGKTDTINIEVVESIGVAGVAINDKTLASKIGVGVQMQLSATVTPDGTDNTVTWVSLQPNIASVTATGLLRGVARGTATITATSTADSTKTDSMSVEVTDAVLVTSILLTHPDKNTQGPDFRQPTDYLYMFSGETKTLEYLIVPETATNKNVDIKSSNTTVATVYSENGKIKIGAGNTEGFSIITLTSVSNTSIVAYLEVYVKPNTGITRSSDDTAVVIGPDNATYTDKTKGQIALQKMMVKTATTSSTEAKPTLVIDATDAWTTTPALQAANSQKLQVTWETSDKDTVEIEVDPANPMKATLKAKKGTKQGVAITAPDTDKNVTITVKPFLNQSMAWSFDVNVREKLESANVTLEGTVPGTNDKVTQKIGASDTYTLSLAKNKETEITAITGGIEPTITSINWGTFDPDKVTFVGNDGTNKTKVKIIGTNAPATLTLTVTLYTYPSSDAATPTSYVVRKLEIITK